MVVRIPGGLKRSHTSAGMTPEMSVSWRVKAAKLVKAPTSVGTVPVKSLVCNCRNSMAVKTPISLILPVNWLSLTSVVVNKSRSVRIKFNSLESEGSDNQETYPIASSLSV